MFEGVVVDAVVGRGDHVERARIGGEGVDFGLRVGGPAERHVGDVGAVFPGVVDRRDDRAARAARFVDRWFVGADAERHDADVLGDAGDPDAVVARRADRPRGVDAVAAGDQVGVLGVVVFGRRGRVFADEVPAVDVVFVAVAVVIDVVVGDLTGVRPLDRAEVGAVGAVAGIDVGDDDVGRADRPFPGRQHVDVVARFARGEAVQGLAGVLQAPLLGEERIVGDRLDPAQEVRFGEDDGGVFFERPGRRRGAFSGDRLDQLEARIAKFGAVGDAGVGASFDPFGVVAAIGPLDDHAVAQRRFRRRGGVAFRIALGRSGSGRERSRDAQRQSRRDHSRDQQGQSGRRSAFSVHRHEEGTVRATNPSAQPLK